MQKVWIARGSTGRSSVPGLSVVGIPFIVCLDEMTMWLRVSVPRSVSLVTSILDLQSAPMLR